MLSTASCSRLAKNVAKDEVKRLDNLSEDSLYCEVKARPVRFSLKLIEVKAKI
jgi:hypothetical protein